MEMITMLGAFDSSSSAAEFGVLAIIVALCVFSIACIWKCYVKMGEPGWVSLIPFYCNWVLCKHTWGHGAMMFTWFIPLVGNILMLATYVKLFKKFGKSTLFGIFVGLFLMPLAFAICGFGDAEFEG